MSLDAYRERLEGCGFGVAQERVSGHMYCIHNLPSLLELLLPRMQQCWDTSPVSGWEGSVLLESEDVTAAVAVRGGRISVEGGTASKPEVRAPDPCPADRSALWAGRACKAPAPHPNTLGYRPRRGRDVVETLFPRHPFRWYSKDAI
ncbi:MAG: hypothetical protein M3Q29_13285 [Chloroflexota bacterium]|nr:hypothetical protein [Chloroflexota bacterium]